MSLFEKLMKKDLIREGCLFDHPKTWAYFLVVYLILANIGFNYIYYYTFLDRVVDYNIDSALRAMQAVVVICFALWAIPALFKKDYDIQWRNDISNCVARKIFI